MPDSQFDDFVGKQLSDLSAPVPEGLWQRMNDQQLDDFFKEKLNGIEINAREVIWQRIKDAQLDGHFADQLINYIAPVPANAFDQLEDARLDRFIGNSLYDLEGTVPTDSWDAVAGALLDSHAGENLDHLAKPVSENVWNKIADHQFDGHIAENLSNLEVPVGEGLWEKVTDQQMDDHFKSRLSDFVAPVSEELWSKIKPREEDDDRGFFYWIRIPMAAAIAGALFIGGLLATYFFYQKQTKELSNKPGVVVSREGNFGNPPVENNKQAPVTNLSNTPPTSLDSAETDSHNRTIKIDNPITTKLKTESSTDIDLEYNSNKIENKERAGWKRKKSAFTVSSGFKIDASARETKRPSSAIRESVFNPSNSEALPLYPEQIVEENQYKSYPQGSTIAMERNTKLLAQELSISGRKRVELPKINCPPVRGRNKWDDFNKDWYVDTYVSPDYSLKTLTNLSASQQYLNLKDSSERMQVGFTAGLRLVKPLNDRVQLTTGLQYSQINQRYTYRSENEIKFTTIITVRTIIRSPGDTLIVRDTSLLQTIGYKNNVVKNRFRSVDIPVLLGYQFGRGSVKVGVNAGVIFNVSSWYEGVVLDTSLAIVPLQKGSNLYKSKLGVSLYTGVQVTKELSKDMLLFVEPYYRHSFTDITNTGLPYQQKFGTAGVMMGVRWSLNRK
ncbi:MAG: outer membrane beta-barrel protein [Sediminibacterium sp.]